MIHVLREREKAIALEPVIYQGLWRQRATPDHGIARIKAFNAAHASALYYENLFRRNAGLMGTKTGQETDVSTLRIERLNIPNLSVGFVYGHPNGTYYELYSETGGIISAITYVRVIGDWPEVIEAVR